MKSDTPLTPTDIMTSDETRQATENPKILTRILALALRIEIVFCILPAWILLGIAMIGMLVWWPFMLLGLFSTEFDNGVRVRDVLSVTLITAGGWVGLMSIMELVMQTTKDSVVFPTHAKQIQKRFMIGLGTLIFGNLYIMYVGVDPSMGDLLGVLAMSLGIFVLLVYPLLMITKTIHDYQLNTLAYFVLPVFAMLHLAHLNWELLTTKHKEPFRSSDHTKDGSR